MNEMKKEIHQRALIAAKDFKRAEANLIKILQEVEELRLFLDFGLTSLYQYAIQKLELSEDVAINFISVARKAKQAPLLQLAIEEGSVSVSKARKVTSVLTPENQEEWIHKIQTLTSKNLEREVAKINPREATPERTKYVSEDRLELRMGISQEMFEEFKRVQDLESKRTAKSASMEETLQALLKVYLEVKDPQKRAQRILSVPRRPNPTVQSGKTVSSLRKHQVVARDEGRCAHIENGQRCENRRWMEVHHIQPRCEGGDHSLDNLTTLCSAHHRLVHAKKIS